MPKTGIARYDPQWMKYSTMRNYAEECAEGTRKYDYSLVIPSDDEPMAFALEAEPEYQFAINGQYMFSKQYIQFDKLILTSDGLGIRGASIDLSKIKPGSDALSSSGTFSTPSSLAFEKPLSSTKTPLWCSLRVLHSIYDKTVDVAVDNDSFHISFGAEEGSVACQVLDYADYDCNIDDAWDSSSLDNYQPSLSLTPNFNEALDAEYKFLDGASYLFASCAEPGALAVMRSSILSIHFDPPLYIWATPTSKGTGIFEHPELLGGGGF